MQIDEIETEPLLPGPAAGAGIGRGLLRCVGPGQEPGPALQSILMEIRGPLDEQAQRGSIEPDFNVATDLHVRSERVRTFEKGARQPQLNRDVRRHRPLDRSQVPLFQRAHRNKQQVRIGQFDVQHLIVVIAAEPPQLIPEGKRITGFGIPDTDAGIQRILR